MLSWHDRTSIINVPDSKVNGADVGPTWGPVGPDGPHDGPMNLAIKGILGRSEPQFSNYSFPHFTSALCMTEQNMFSLVSSGRGCCHFVNAL